MKKNYVRMRVTIRGIRPLIQHAFGRDSIPLEGVERTGKAGNDPEEWRKTCMVLPSGQLYLKSANVFSCIRDGAKHTRGLQSKVAATLQVE